MRKLLILVMVLGMASLASAVPVLTVSDANPTVGDTFYLYISGTSADATGDGDGVPAGGYASQVTLDYASYASYVINGNTNANPYISISSTAAVTAEAGGLAGYATTFGNPRFFAAPAGGDWAEGTDVDTGLWFTYEMYADSIGTSLVGLTADWGSPEIGALSITVVDVPEPMTMALLGLGGLFLRRRK